MCWITSPLRYDVYDKKIVRFSTGKISNKAQKLLPSKLSRKRTFQKIRISLEAVELWAYERRRKNLQNNWLMLSEVRENEAVAVEVSIAIPENYFIQTDFKEEIEKPILA